MARYRRVLVKLSGAFSGPAEFGFDKAAVDAVHSIPNTSATAPKISRRHRAIASDCHELENEITSRIRQG
ncbi:MAG: hypothetical protein JOZ65_24165 [Chloroflexi bacterium]|nr:hypothetical protein [Chloroflexota bacterium]